MTHDRRVAIVTGGGQGLGRATAIALAKAGMDVAIIGRTESKLAETAKLMSREGEVVVADLSNGDQVTAAFAQVLKRFGRLDVLINNAAVYNPFRLDEASNAEIERMIANSFTAPVFCLREAIKAMRLDGRGGDIVNISSQSVQMPQPFMTVYSAAKAGLETMSRGLRNELRGEPFRIINFSVGVIKEEGTHIWTSPEFRERVTGAFMASGVAPFYTFPGTSAESLAQMITQAVTAPPDLYLEQIDARGSFTVG